MQAGVVLAAAGIGMNYVSRNIDPYRAEPDLLVQRAGCCRSASGSWSRPAVSYMMSKRLGLLPAERGRDRPTSSAMKAGVCVVA